MQNGKNRLHRNKKSEKINERTIEQASEVAKIYDDMSLETVETNDINNNIASSNKEKIVKEKNEKNHIKNKIKSIPEQDRLEQVHKIQAQNRLNAKNKNYIKENSVYEIEKKEQEQEITIPILDYDLNESIVQKLKTLNEFDIKDLVMDVYEIIINDEIENKTVLIIAPTDWDNEPEKKNTNSFIYVTNKNNKRFVSGSTNSCSYSLNIENHYFIINSRLEYGNFISYIYPIDLELNKNLKINKKIFRGKNKCLGHSYLYINHNLSAHVLPLSNSNMLNDKCGVMVCFHDSDNNKYIYECSNHEQEAQITYLDKSYIINGKWKNNKFRSEFMISESKA